MQFFLSFLAVLFINTILPIFVYGLFSKYLGLEEPKDIGKFFASVVVQKIGTTIGFVGLFFLVQGAVLDSWLTYSLIWVLMYAVVEIGQAMGPNYTYKEVVAGIISEAIYFPLAGWAIVAIIS